MPDYHPPDPDKHTIKLTLTEVEYKTMMTALHRYGHFCLDACVSLSQAGASYSYDDAAEGAEKAKRCGDRAFDLKGRITQEWETK